MGRIEVKAHRKDAGLRQSLTRRFAYRNDHATVDIAIPGVHALMDGDAQNHGERKTCARAGAPVLSSNREQTAFRYEVSDITEGWN